MIKNPFSRKPSKPEILIITPTRQRVKRAKEMIAAWEKCTTGHSEIVFYVDDDDPQLKQYQGLVRDKIRVEVGQEHGLCAGYNFLFDNYPGYEFYAPFDDDQHVRTKGWEDIAIAKLREHDNWGLVYGDDLLQHQDIATAPILSGKLMSTLGWVGLPGLDHMYCDNVWMDVAKACDGLFYVPEIVIEHMHFLNGKAEKDETYVLSDTEDMYSRDKAVYDKWKAKELPALTKRLQKLMKNG
jgi:hypothetical protein